MVDKSEGTTKKTAFGQTQDLNKDMLCIVFFRNPLISLHKVISYNVPLKTECRRFTKNVKFFKILKFFKLRSGWAGCAGIHIILPAEKYNDQVYEES